MSERIVKKAQSLTPRQRKFIKGLSEGKSATQAAIDSGYSSKSAKAIASEMLTKPYIQAAIGRLMEKSGLDDFTLAVMHKELIAGRELNQDGTPKMQKIIGKGGEVVEIIPPIDWAARARGLDMYFRLIGAYAQNETSSQKVIIRIQSNVKDESAITET